MAAKTTASKKSSTKTKKQETKSSELSMPTPKEMEKLKQQDADFQLASTDTVQFLESRRQAIFNIARPYRLDPEELFQEGYEVLLTCLRDYTPIFERADGSCVSVKFTTFFGNRMDGRAMEMRNRDPEYQARAAHIQDMTPEEKASFRENPPLLVQHLDLETPMQETLRGEASEAQEENAGNVMLKVIRDSFFEKKLNELVAKERDDKKRAILMHVKVGGVYSFQDVAYHFGVTDSRASQILNELMDAFYVQRLIDGDLKSVKYDFQKLKFNEKRAVRLIEDAIQHADQERQKQIENIFSGSYQSLLEAPKSTESSDNSKNNDTSSQEAAQTFSSPFNVDVFPFQDVFTEGENERFPLLSIELRPIDSLTQQTFKFRSREESDKELPYITSLIESDPSSHPIVVTEDGIVIDGNRRIKALQARGETKVMCMTRQMPKETDQKQMRVAINLRAHNESDKTELYHAISALIDTKLSQQKISKLIGISRTNVIVYSKVKDKAAPAIRQLFEDGFIQITNASSCADLPEEAQTELANFIRHYGNSWAKGGQFSELYEAAANNTIKELKTTQSPLPSSITAPISTTKHQETPQNTVPSPAPTTTPQHVQERLIQYEQALKDSETWTAQREAIITRQTNELVEARNEIENLKRELDAAELLKYGDPKALEASFKQLRQFYAITERLAASKHNLTLANKDIRGITLERKQILELNQLLDDLSKEFNTLRVEMISKSKKV